MCEGRSGEGRACCIAMCNMLNQIADHDPSLWAAVGSTWWTANGLDPDIECIDTGDQLLTNVVGLVNGGLRQMGYRCHPQRIGNTVKFIPQEVDHESQDSN